MNSHDQFGSPNGPSDAVADWLQTPGYRPAEVALSAPAAPADGSLPAVADQSSTVEVAKDQAASVVSGAADAASNVAGVAKEQAGQVAAEAGYQVRRLLGQAQSELSDQAGQQQLRVAAGLHDLGRQLRAMADGSASDGAAVDLARQAAHKSHQVAGWLENRDPGSVLNEVRSFARRRPGVFLAVAMGAGLAMGRLARGLATDSTDAPRPSTSTPRPEQRGVTRPVTTPAIEGAWARPGVGVGEDRR
jgi:hypothetical protein